MRLGCRNRAAGSGLLCGGRRQKQWAFSKAQEPACCCCQHCQAGNFRTHVLSCVRWLRLPPCQSFVTRPGSGWLKASLCRLWASKRTPKGSTKSKVRPAGKNTFPKCGEAYRPEKGFRVRFTTPLLYKLQKLISNKPIDLQRFTRMLKI